MKDWEEAHSSTPSGSGRSVADRKRFRDEVFTGLQKWLLPATGNQRFGLQLEVGYFLQENANGRTAWNKEKLDYLAKRIGDDLCVYLVGQNLHAISGPATASPVSQGGSDAN